MVELRWQGVRKLRKMSPLFKQQLDKAYLERGFDELIKTIPLFSQLTKTQLDILKSRVGFENFGKQNWSANFEESEQVSFNQRIEKDALVVAENACASSLYVILSGFARVSHLLNNNHKTVGTLSGGDLFGAFEVIHNHYQPRQIGYQYSLRAIGYLDVIRIPVSVIEQLVFSGDPKQQVFDTLALQHRLLPGYDALGERSKDQDTSVDTQTHFMEFFVQHRIINARKAMFIDLDRCTGCDDCVRACAATHDNNPRFVRSGVQHANLLVTNACMHCIDPVCLVGCPTGAISRRKTSEVVIDDTTCIGCSGCANACPYGNIKMVERFDHQGNPLLDDDNKPVLKATKCDLCLDSLGQPACEMACPHGALKRTDVKGFECS